MIHFVCWKWEPKTTKWKKFNKYRAKHVNVLYSMLKRHMHDPFRLVCLTDMPQGINNEIDILPVWKDFEEYGGCYRRLKLFKREMRELIGEKIVSIDLDCVILSDISPLFRNLPDFKIMKASGKNLYCGALFAVRPGTCPQGWEGFEPKRVVFRENRCHLYRGTNFIGTDQAVLGDVFPNAPTWHWKDGIYNFREMTGQSLSCRKVWARNKYKIGQLPPNARIVFFNGKFDPSQLSLHREYEWIRKNWR